MSQSFDVIVIGGGPAGSTVGTLLADAGWKTLLLEREVFPRDHIGEALIPSAVPILERLGVKKRLDERGYLRKRGTTFLWGAEQTPWTVYFHEGKPSVGYSYQIWRPDFDQLLLDNCEAHGVEVLRGQGAREIVREEGRVAGVRFADSTGRPAEARARLVIDASGQSGLIAKTLDLRRWDREFRNMALYGYFRGAGTLPGIDATNTLVEGYEDGWFWAIPLHVGLTSVGTVMDTDVYSTLRSKDLREFFFQQLAKTRLTADLVASGELADGPRVLRDWSYTAERFWGDGFILLGDAACFIDPLFSTGVYLAMQQAMNAAACATSWLRGDATAAEAFDFYEEEYRGEYRDLRQICLLMYGGVNKPMGSVFWNARKIQNLPESLEARCAFVRLISGRERRGFELSPLSRLDLPAEWRDSLAGFERSLRARLPALGGGSADERRLSILRESERIDEGHPFLTSVLCREDALESRERFMVRDQQLHRGYVLRTPLNPRGLAVDRATVERLLPLVDGRKNVGEIVQALVGEERATRRHRTILQLADLYWYGALNVVPGLETDAS